VLYLFLLAGSWFLLAPGGEAERMQWALRGLENDRIQPEFEAPIFLTPNARNPLKSPDSKK
jgi:hypothetical protein